MTTREDRIHTVKDFLARPIVIDNGKWKTADEVGKELGSNNYNFPERLINDPMYREKLQGFLGLRATLVVKLQVNSQPFQAGRLLLQYIPYAQYLPDKTKIINTTITGRTGCPRVDLDLSVGTEVTLRIPYVSPHIYYNLVTGQGAFGQVFVVVYSALRDKLKGELEWTLWAHLEDIDIQYPTGLPVYTGQSYAYHSTMKKINDGTITNVELGIAIKNKTLEEKPKQIFAQMSAELTQLKKNNAPSAGIGHLAEGLDFLSTIPILGNAFTTPAWISHKASDILKLFGFSKPTVMGLPCETKLRTQTRMSNYDGADCSHRMALSSQNQLQTESGMGGSSKDEMAISSIISIPNYFARFTWKTSDQYSLWADYVTPFKARPIVKDDDAGMHYCTHMAYVANTFTYWRGSIIYTFKFVKTQFHSGRLMIVFIPGTDGTEYASVLETDKCIKEVVDLRTSTEVSFTVPYVATRPWLFVRNPYTEKATRDMITGVIAVRVLNELVAVDTVESDVEVLVEVSAGPDMSFAGPTIPAYAPVRSKKITAQIMGEDVAIDRASAQQGKIPAPINNQKILGNWSPEANCIGEKIVSIRQLLKRFCQVEGDVSLKKDASGVSESVVISPFATKSILEEGKLLDEQYTLLDYYYQIFSFWRGSMRFKVLAIDDKKISGHSEKKKLQTFVMVKMFNAVHKYFEDLLTKFSSPNIIQKLDIPDIFNNGCASTQVIDPGLEGMIEIEVPYYNVSHISPTTSTSRGSDGKPIIFDNILKGNQPPSILVMTPQTFNYTGDTDTENVSFTVFRAVGDDYSLMYTVGCPPIQRIPYKF